MWNKYQTEICVDNANSIDTTAEFNIDRLELCSALDLDGLTPSVALVEYAKTHSSAERHVMIRPRSGDFIYSRADIEIMHKEIEIMADIGIHGIVIGCLKPDNSIDLSLTKLLINTAKAKNLTITFHRAIDMTPDYIDSIQGCIDLGIHRILTSGAAQNVDQGMKQLKKAAAQFSDRVEIMAGGGVKPENITMLKSIGIRHFHFSASSKSCIVDHNAVFERKSLTKRYSDAHKIQAYLHHLHELK
ncbi:MAG: copper homeostasis protein CutC [Francisellaceae bacterium]